MAVSGSKKPCLWNGTMALLILLTALGTGLPCQHLRIHYDTFTWDALRLLHDMAPNSTQLCQLHNAPFFPDTLLHTHLNPQQAAATALRILQHLFHTLATNATAQHWHAQPRHRLLNQLQHYIHHLQLCRPDSDSPFKGPRNPLLTINKYFSSIHLFLHAHNHSACAWDHVRLEARDCFLYVDRLTRQMKHRAALDPALTTHHERPASISTGTLRRSGGTSSNLGWDLSEKLTSFQPEH
ncbi:interferon-like [Pithys albifrons albifrons]|uniref:interferon-like n=1 Tax=Pithys albifrons albifrons TaxID=3385563 RepID=UPI003A5CB0BB